MGELFRRLRASLAGEVSSADLERRRAAGAAAYGLAEEADATEGDDHTTRCFRLCAWNAFALQTLADSLLDADTDADPATAGYVPRSTLQYAGACLDEVGEWLREARIVQSDASSRIAARLPARLPRWYHDEPTRESELAGLRRAFETLAARAESGMAAAAANEPEAGRLRRVCAEMKEAAQYAGAVGAHGAGPADRGEARSRLLDALEHAYLLGQLLALPSLVELARVAQDRAEGLPLADAPSWLQIGAGWPVLDRAGIRIGNVVRVVGERGTGEFEGLEVSADVGDPGVFVPKAAIAAIGRGEIRIHATRAELESA
ncbi:MAG TPA: hypothetical protein VFA30_00015 [Gaiellaceae bacterium]|nr:hypothetical protein [Gaiellaceae bacterium]